jgi:membrane-bound lytic murein transglycosylase B
MLLLLLTTLAAAITPVAPRLADTPQAIAAQVVVVEHTLRDPTLPTDADLLTYGHLQQVIYRALVHDTASRAAVLDALPADIADIARANIDATAEIMGTVGKKRTAVPAWRIVPPAAPDELVAHYQAAEAAYGVPWEILAAIHLVETRMGRLRGVSTAGAAGPMQFIPATWARFGEGDIEDNRDAIMAAARHLSHHGAPEDIRKALWHYNPTDHYVNAVTGYAALMQADPLAFRGYYAWEVYYQTIVGTLLLPVGYAQTAPIPVRQWCATAGRCPEDSP